jgi:hypothetical protein
MYQSYFRPAATQLTLRHERSPWHEHHRRGGGGGGGTDNAVRIQVISDIHMEIQGTADRLPYFEVAAPVLALVGDIGNPRLPGYRTFLLTQADRYDTVMVLAGNHEYYQIVDLKDPRSPGNMGGVWAIEDMNDRIAQICAERVNLIFMNMTTHRLRRPNGRGGDVVVLGTTLWSELGGSSGRKEDSKENGVGGSQGTRGSLVQDQAQVMSNDYRNIYERGRPRIPHGFLDKEVLDGATEAKVVKVGEEADQAEKEIGAGTAGANEWQRRHAKEMDFRNMEVMFRTAPVFRKKPKRLITADVTNAMHRRELAWLKGEIQRVVVADAAVGDAVADVSASSSPASLAGTLAAVATAPTAPTTVVSGIDAEREGDLFKELETPEAEAGKETVGRTEVGTAATAAAAAAAAAVAPPAAAAAAAAHDGIGSDAMSEARTPTATTALGEKKKKKKEKKEKKEKEKRPPPRITKVVVITHHAPTAVDTIEDIDDPMSLRATTRLDSTRLEYLLKPPLAAWIFGHTHKNRDAVVGGVRVVSNQLGYVAFNAELKDFSTNFVVSIP